MGLMQSLGTALGGWIKGKMGVADGIASLDSNGKIPVSQLPSAITGPMKLIGELDASTNTEPVTPSSSNAGNTWYITGAGTIAGLALDDGDWLVSTGTGWIKQEGSDLGSVQSFADALDAAWSA